MPTPNKDEGGDFTDEAIEAVERELADLATKIGVSKEELGERVADATFRETYDYIEMELIMMRLVAMRMLMERVKEQFHLTRVLQSKHLLDKIRKDVDLMDEIDESVMVLANQFTR